MDKKLKPCLVQARLDILNIYVSRLRSVYRPTIFRFSLAIPTSNKSHYSHHSFGQS